MQNTNQCEDTCDAYGENMRLLRLPILARQRHRRPRGLSAAHDLNHRPSRSSLLEEENLGLE